jgi:hypothetical protein
VQADLAEVPDAARQALATVLGADKAAAVLRHAPQRYVGDGVVRSISASALVLAEALGGKAAASNAARRHPKLLTTPPATITAAMQATMRVLGSRLKARQVIASKGGAVLAQCPAQIDAATNALTAALGADGVKEAIANNTALLAIPPATVKAAWAALQEMLAPLGDRRVARRAARQNTMLLATPAAKLRAGLPALVELMGLEEALQMVTRDSSLLSARASNLKLIMPVLTNTLGQKGAYRAVVSSPHLLSAKPETVEQVSPTPMIPEFGWRSVPPPHAVGCLTCGACGWVKGWVALQEVLGERHTARSVAIHFPSLLTTAASTLRGSMPALSSVLGEEAARNAVRANPGLLAAGPKRILAAAIELEKLLLRHTAATSAIRLAPQLLRTEPEALRASMRVLMCVAPRTCQARLTLALPVFATNRV